MIRSATLEINFVYFSITCIAFIHGKNLVIHGKIQVIHGPITDTSVEFAGSQLNEFIYDNHEREEKFVSTYFKGGSQLKEFIYDNHDREKFVSMHFKGNVHAKYATVLAQN